MKKKKAEEYTEITGLLGDGTDYHIYHMRFLDYLISWAIGFALAAVVIYTFFQSPVFLEESYAPVLCRNITRSFEQNGG